MGDHKAIVAASVHVPGYVQSGDPGAVGASKVWVDTSGGAAAWVIKIRNAANDGWETITAAGNDADAIHDNVGAEISAIANKATPVDADYLLIEDSAAADAKKYITIGALLNLDRGELFLTAAGGWPSTTNGCAANALTEYGTNDIDMYSLDFDTGSDEYAQWTVWMPDRWNAGTITAKFAWTSAGGTPAQTVEWNIQGRAYANDDPIDAAWGTPVGVSDILIATDDMHYSAETAAVTLAGTPAAGEMVQFRVFRDVSDDNVSDDARLLGVKVYYTKS